MAKTISHDPFARQSLMRETVMLPPGTCAWCGQVKRTRFNYLANNGKPYLYRYGTESDGRPGQTNWHDGLFCSKSCHDDYHS